MTDVAEPGRRGDVAEAAVAVVLEEHVAAADRRDIQVRVPVVVDVGKRSGHADLARNRHAGGSRDVLELSATDVLPELVAADLVDEVDVSQAVPIDIGDGEAVAVIVVSRLVGLAGVVDNAVPERDAALRQAVGELEIVEGGDALSGLDLCVLKRDQPRRVLQVWRDQAYRLGSLALAGQRRRARPRAEKKD